MFWIEFLISAVVIVIAGVRLTEYADKLSDKLKLGKLWIGVLLLGMITSLPEAVTCLYSVIALKANDLAIGNLLGSNNFNPLLIVILDIATRGKSISSIVKPQETHRISVYFAIILTAIVVLDIMVPASSLFAFGRFSVLSLFVCVLYFAAMRHIGNIEKASGESSQYFPEVQESIQTIWKNIFVSTIVVVIAAIFLANSADTIADKTGLGRTFVGSIFLAIVTSLPEMVVTISALRLSSIDLAIGNIFGSNMTNMFIVFLCGAFAKDGPILANVSISNGFTGLLSITLTLFGYLAIRSKKQLVIGSINLFSLLMLAIFVSGTFYLYTIR